MRVLSLMALGAVAALGGAAFVGPSSAKAQTATTQPCGVETYSAADQKYVTLPCSGSAASSTQQTQGQPANCGVETYSVAEQKYVGVPCNAQPQKTSDGKDCGVETYSVADQKYVGMPCTQK